MTEREPMGFSAKKWQQLTKNIRVYLKKQMTMYLLCASIVRIHSSTHLKVLFRPKREECRYVYAPVTRMLSDCICKERLGFAGDGFGFFSSS
ncbi:hypothetical protein CEXT_333371 [Caerostris extrusa]|uniref:Uncharacterized protein n=1 Tax=Caerostris extrusa TaxID=172846 RepID=A0AAV4WRP3_CAEEX|nr:hypothetical protein CEXT_333371 [Caerostris extrusa]